MTDVVYTDEFGPWWAGLSMEEQESVRATVGLLESQGVYLDSHIAPRSHRAGIPICANYGYSTLGARTVSCLPSIQSVTPCC